ncbi:protein kinase [uncultured Methanomethylovorans sp.]|uniref:protein kinase domain-containing protein n=1 Tax=uncultured Methanomethylovorans sp. TaxID=183759 RepID=UPI002AA92C97|nr:protein kinase [uncultured Methanomethylovorans sp.]
MKKAIEYCDKALEINPKYGFALSCKGVVLSALGRYEEAIKCYDKALEINPKKEVYWNNKGNALSHLGRHEEAIRCYDKALKINPKHVEALNHKQSLLLDIKVRNKGACIILLNEAESAFERAHSFELSGSKLKEAKKYFDAQNYTVAKDLAEQFISQLIQQQKEKVIEAIRGSEELLSKATNLNISFDSELIDKAKRQSEKGNYVEAKDSLNVFNDQLNEIIKDQADKVLVNAEKTLEKAKSSHIEIDEGALKEAQRLFDKQNYIQSIELCNKFNRRLNSLLEQEREKTETAIKSAEIVHDSFKVLKVECDVKHLEKAKSCFDDLMYVEAVDHCKTFITESEELLSELKPSLSVAVPDKLFKHKSGRKTMLLLKNAGRVSAENIRLEITGDIEHRLLAVIVDIGPGESLEIGIWIKPLSEGDLPVDIFLKYKDALGREYQNEGSIWIEVADMSSSTPNSGNNGSNNKKRLPENLSLPQSSSYMIEELRDHYSDISFVGKGGFASVYRATNKDGKVVALKIPLNLDSATGKSFAKEIALWKRLNHDNIIKIYDLNVLQFPYIEMEYAEKGPLNNISKSMDVETVSTIIFNVSEGLKHAHKNGIIHRDLKPHNILLTADMIPKITDWGLSKVMTQSTSSHSAGYTPIYASLEQISPKKFGKPDIRTDVYQLGVIFYELVTGKTPFDGGDFSEAGFAILSEYPDLPSSCNPSCSDLDNIIMKCLEKKPTDRYQNMQEFQADLASFLKREYSNSLRKSTGDLRKSCIYCGDLVLINAKVGDAEEALKFALDFKNYASGNYIEDVEDVIKRLDYVMERKMVIGEELMSKIKVIVHQVKMGR